ncbi:hypothetical protein F5Y09DRAFT_341577 [Xylaria sp. FL1042]|nr:hypothetical protein F5Y09DRAFT_341577 [Xylaria sp. FL1042]
MLGRLFAAAEDELLLDSTGDIENVEGLRQQLHEIDEELGVLELQHDVRSVRSKEEAVRKLEEKYLLHEMLMKLSKNGPKASLKEAVILTSNEICDDCRRFKDSVNRYFNLRIEIDKSSRKGLKPGPLGSTNYPQTADFTWSHAAQCILVGELKRHGTISRRRWTGEQVIAINTTDLKEVDVDVTSRKRASARKQEKAMVAGPYFRQAGCSGV